jgi:hypothetical protein
MAGSGLSRLKEAVAKKKSGAAAKKEEPTKRTEAPIKKAAEPVRKTEEKIEPETKKRMNPPDEPEPPVDVPEPVLISSPAPPLNELIMNDDRLEELPDKLAVFRAVLKRYDEIEKGKKAQAIVDEEIKRFLSRKK